MQMSICRLRMAATHIRILLLLWNYLHIEGNTFNKCYFKSKARSSEMQCNSPTAAEIMEAVKTMNTSGIDKIWMTRNNITEIPEGLFQFSKLSGMKELHLSGNSISKLPENLFKSPHLGNVERLYLDHNKLSKLRSNGFIYLKKLKYLDAEWNKIKVVEPGAFTSNPAGLLEINLRKNEIKYLSDDLFQGEPFTNLTTLNFRNNQISEMPKCIFASDMFPNLTFLHFEENNISRIPALPNFNLPSLRKLYLQNNQVASISPYMFNSSKWTSLQTLNLEGNRIAHLPSNLFSSMSLENLRWIYLNKNSLKELPEELFINPGLIKFRSIYLSENKIEVLPDKLFSSSNLEELTLLILSKNKIKTLASKLFQNTVIKRLQILDLSHNEITVIPSGCFQNLENIQILKLNNNKIRQVRANMFPNKFNNLLKLDLSHNNISSIKDIVQLFLSNRNLLPKLYVRFNKLKVQVVDFITATPGIIVNKTLEQYPGIHMNVEFNNISSFELFHKSRNTNADYQADVLDKSKFKIKGNHVFSVLSLVRSTLGINLNNIDISNLREISDPENLIRLHALIKTFPYNYSCDCDMLNYLKLQDRDSFKAGVAYLKKMERLSIGKNDFKNLLCGSPQHLSGRLLSELRKSELQCQKTNCTNESQCVCTNTPSNNTIRINCTGIGITYIPDILTSSYVDVYLGFNQIKHLAAIKTVEVLNLLDLSYNLVQYLPGAFFTSYPNINHLNLAGNRLVTLPAVSEWKNMNNLRFIEFSGNAFVCNCSGLELQKTLLYLNNRAHPDTRVLDIGMIKCDTPIGMRNKVIYSLPEPDFGCPFVNIILILTLTLSLLLLFVIVIFIAYIFRYYIHLCLFVHCGWRFYYNYKDEQTMYDVFISYSSLDSDWVEEHLVNPLERLDPPYNLCLHERDFQVGIPICDNITRAIEGSKCTVVVVSRNWLESDWCQFEFRVAHCLATIEKQTRLLVILKEQLPNAEIEGDLQLYMRTFTYLDSANQLFWARLLNDLPAPYVGKYDKRMKDRADNADNIELQICNRKKEND